MIIPRREGTQRKKEAILLFYLLLRRMLYMYRWTCKNPFRKGNELCQSPERVENGHARKNFQSSAAIHNSIFLSSSIQIQFRFNSVRIPLEFR